MPIDDRQLREVLHYIRDCGPVDPYFTLRASPMRDALGLSDADLSAALMALHERRMLIMTATGLTLSDIGETEAQALG